MKKNSTNSLDKPLKSWFHKRTHHKLPNKIIKYLSEVLLCTMYSSALIGHSVAMPSQCCCIGLFDASTGSAVGCHTGKQGVYSAQPVQNSLSYRGYVPRPRFQEVSPSVVQT